LALGFYDVAIAWNHGSGQAWIISHGLPETEPNTRRKRAEIRLRYFRAIIEGKEHPAANTAVCQRADKPVSIQSPQRPVPFAPGITSNFSRDEYLAAVARAIEYIRAGDVFQVNLSQRLLHPAGDDPREVYLRLRRLNPAPMAGYFDLGRMQILSASPERFLLVADNRVETRPIKGTRPRIGKEAIDRAAAAELESSQKDRAENVMIVDLLRNDLSKSCVADSVRVERLCGIEAFRHVLHLVSVVSGRLRGECSPIDLLCGAFPGGSITGAPKPRAMEIITELEGVARGAYCGSLGYLGFDGAMDTSLLIRTITVGGGWLQLPVGGGVVAQSTPEGEYDETWHKAQGMLQAL
jgi:para-aminobenzoate synthetase component 1